MNIYSELIDKTEEYSPPLETQNNPKQDTKPSEKEEAAESKSLSSRLIELLEDMPLFHNDKQEAFADIELSGRLESVSLDSSKFSNYLAMKTFSNFKKPLSKLATGEVIGVLRARAIFDCEESKVHLRVAGSIEKKHIYFELGRNDGQMVVVTPDGWKLTKESPYKFIRSSLMQEMPLPVRGGSICEFVSFVNIESQKDYKLLTSWLFSTLFPDQPRPY